MALVHILAKVPSNILCSHDYVTPYLEACFRGGELVDKLCVIFASGAIGTLYVLVRSDSRKHGAGRLEEFLWNGRTTPKL